MTPSPIQQVRESLDGAIDSMEYVNKAHPEATGYAVRLERIEKCKATLAHLDAIENAPVTTPIKNFNVTSRDVAGEDHGSTDRVSLKKCAAEGRKHDSGLSFPVSLLVAKAILDTAGVPYAD